MTQMTPDLYKAILAMDSYNRGYGAAIKFGTLPNNSDSELTNTSIGNALIYDKKSDAAAQAISFYGIAYSLNGETVISFRGTDDKIFDPLYGYGIGTANPISPQGDMAINFYKTVVQSVYGTGVALNSPALNVSLTGHSLGGGLAGYVADLYGQDALIFDNMPFEAAASNAYLLSYTNPALKSLIYGSAAQWNPNISGIRGYYTQGDDSFFDDDFLTNLRFLQYSSMTPIGIGTDVELVGVYDGLDAHSMSTLAILLYADVAAGGVTDWKNAAKYFWPVMYDDTFAGEIGFNNNATLLGRDHDAGDYASIMRQLLAYSIIDEGTLVFGNTGIRAFYNDANNLGAALSGSDVSGQLTDHAEDISKAFVQYAAQLALNKIELKAGINDSVLQNVLDYSGNVLTVDFSESQWDLAGPAQGVAPQYYLTKGVIGEVGNSAIRDAMQVLWGDSSSSIFEKISFAATNSGTFNLTEPASLGKAQLFIGGDGSSGVSYINGSSGNDLLVGNIGVDHINGGAGDDLLVGGGSTTNNLLSGGDGNDLVTYQDEVGAIAYNNGLVQRSSGATDALNGIESITGTNFDDSFTLSGPIGGVIDGGDGEDRVTYDSGGFYDQQKNVMWNEDGTVHDTLKNIETLDAKYATLVVANDNYQLIKSKVA